MTGRIEARLRSGFFSGRWLLDSTVSNDEISDDGNRRFGTIAVGTVAAIRESVELDELRVQMSDDVLLVFDGCSGVFFSA